MSARAPIWSKKLGPTTLTNDTIDQIEYVVKMVGVDHVRFGSDIDFHNIIIREAYMNKYPGAMDTRYFSSYSKEWGYGWLENMPKLTIGLVARGFTDTEVK